MSRVARIAELIKEEVFNIIKKHVSDPRIGFISITGVDVSSDLKNAKIYISILGTEEQKQDSMAGLESATSFIRNQLAPMLKLRTMPFISFVRDDSLERGSQVLGVMSGLNNDKQKLTGNKTSPKRR